MRGLFACIVCGVFITAWGLPGDTMSDIQAKEKKNKTKENVTKFMQAKLHSSKEVLEGLMTEDFDLIQNGTTKMIEMSNATEWQVVEGPIFARQSAEFRSAAKTILENAQKKNLDGASLGYLHLTMTCIACHKQIKQSVVVMK